MATATPKDQRLLEFLDSAGKSDFESFAVSRDDVVAARLNKRYIEAVIYDLAQSVQSVADLKRTVLRQAWKRNQWLKQQLAEAGIPLTPLLLVQVANGEKTVEEAELELIRLCKVPPEAIGKHSADDPDPVLMAAIANDSSKEVLIFKQSAGTGFDAPRSFVLASTKLVSDPDFAMQFIGRVMRVALAVRKAFPDKSIALPEALDTAYVYLADANAQKGFEQAVQAVNAVKTQLEGQTEKLQPRKMSSGAVVLTNKPTPQFPLSYESSQSLQAEAPIAEKDKESSKLQTSGPQTDLFAGDAFEQLDTLEAVASPGKKLASLQPKTHVELIEYLQQREIRVYPRRQDLCGVPDALQAEQRPQFGRMGELSHSVAAKLEIPPSLADSAIRVARNQLKDIERHTELTTGETQDEQVLIVTDRNALAKEARSALSILPQVEEADILEILKVLAARLLPLLRARFEELDPDNLPDDKELQRMARDAAHWVAKQKAVDLAEGLHSAIAQQAETISAQPLPKAMVFPVALPLAKSPRNLYGVLPPTQEVLQEVAQKLLLDDRVLLRDQEWMLADGGFKIGAYDGSLAMNKDELAFAKALDRSAFVHWWQRNPDRKPYAVRLVRGEHKNNFYPDFVVCLEHYPGDQPLLRLVETKHDVKDAANKAKHVPNYYGKVLFLTRDQTQLRWVNEDGSMGSVVDLDDLSALREWMRSTRPDQSDGKLA